MWSGEQYYFAFMPAIDHFHYANGERVKSPARLRCFAMDGMNDERREWHRIRGRPSSALAFAAASILFQPLLNMDDCTDQQFHLTSSYPALALCLILSSKPRKSSRRCLDLIARTPGRRGRTELAVSVVVHSLRYVNSKAQPCCFMFDCGRAWQFWAYLRRAEVQQLNGQATCSSSHPPFGGDTRNFCI